MGVEAHPGCHNHDPKIVEFKWHSPDRWRLRERTAAERAIPLAAGPDRNFNLKEIFCCRFAVDALTINNRCYCCLQSSGAHLSSINWAGGFHRLFQEPK